jgi:hypothetical protein
MFVRERWSTSRKASHKVRARSSPSPSAVQGARAGSTCRPGGRAGEGQDPQSAQSAYRPARSRARLSAASPGRRSRRSSGSRRAEKRRRRLLGRAAPQSAIEALERSLVPVSLASRRRRCRRSQVRTQPYDAALALVGPHRAPAVARLVDDDVPEPLVL